MSATRTAVQPARGSRRLAWGTLWLMVPGLLLGIAYPSLIPAALLALNVLARHRRRAL